VAVGDATGHGMRAGTMVASTKSLFAAFGSSLSFVEFFNRCTEIIKVMHLGNMYMAMMLVRIQGRRLVVSSAGMPPVLIYRSHGRYVEEVVTKGMPLGGFTGYDYQQKETELGAGDAILLMTDGFPELFNEDNEMLDYPRVKKIFERAAPNSAEDIVEHLSKAAEAWSAGKPQSDDSTFVVLKVMEDAGAWS
jgi:serine phosphatase RsbU (regulator of sigma subunit)